MKLQEHWTIEVSLPSYDSEVLRLLGIAVSTDGCKLRDGIFIPAAGVDGQGRLMRLCDPKLDYSECPSFLIIEAINKFEAGLPPPWAWNLAKAIVEGLKAK